MKKLIVLLFLTVFVIGAASPTVYACGEEDYVNEYNGHELDWYDIEYYEVIKISKTNIVGEKGDTLKRYNIPTKYLEPGANPKKGDWIAVFKDPNTKKIVTIFELDMD